MQKFLKSELEAKSIFEMRALAKEVGISAPTKMNKAELVDMVFKITNGEIEPPQAPRRGRPKKYGDATEQMTSEKPQIAQNVAQRPHYEPQKGGRLEYFLGHIRL